MEQNTQGWDRYQKGLDYNAKIALRPTVDKNERFYAGRQWEGLDLKKLSPIVLNVIKKIADFKRSVVMSDSVSMQFSAEGIPDVTNDEAHKLFQQVAANLSGYAKTLWENLKVDSMNEDGLLNGQISGDTVSYWFWDERIKGANWQEGDINGELINNVNYFPGDPNDSTINDAYGAVQPYILLAFRRQVKDIRAEAKQNKVKKKDIEGIVADDETENQAGDRAKQELEADGEDGKCIVLLEMWKGLVDTTEPDPVTGEEVTTGQEYHIMARKSTRAVIVRDTWDTKLTRYPVALMNWTQREGSAHGEADLTSMIPNQIAINITASMIDSWVRKHGYPKVLYDSTRIGAWSNDISTAIPVNGTDTGGVGGAAQYMQPAQLSAAVIQYLDRIIQLTKELSGANESALGETAPTNTSAIITNVQSATRPLSSQKRRFYQYCEDIGLIWLDFWISQYTKYPNRTLEITTQEGEKQVVQLDTKILKEVRLKLKLDIGPSTQWNEAAAVQTLDGLLTRQLITFIEYLKRLPNGVIPNKQGLITDRESAEAAQRAADKELMYELMAQKMEEIMPTLPPETQNQLQMLQRNEPEQYEAQVKQLVKQSRPYANNVEGGSGNEVSTVQQPVNG